MIYALSPSVLLLLGVFLVSVTDIAIAQDNATDTTGNDASAADTATPAPTPTLPEWQGCVNPNSGQFELVTKGEPITICLTLSDGFDWSQDRTYMTLNFRPTVDEYSRFHVPQCKYPNENNAKMGIVSHGCFEKFLMR